MNKKDKYTVSYKYRIGLCYSFSRSIEYLNYEDEWFDWYRIKVASLTTTDNFNSYLPLWF